MSHYSRSAELPSPSRAAREPVVLTNLVAALILALCSLLQQFGVPLTDGQQQAISSVAGLLLLLAAALFSRRLATPLAAPRDEHGRPLVSRPEGRQVPPA
jgi:LPXTG-motif cell wall-anchored protein